MIISPSLPPRMKHVSDKFVETIKTHFIFRHFLFKKRAFYEILRKSMVQPDRSQMKIGRMRIACWITKATNIHTVYVTLIAS